MTYRMANGGHNWHIVPAQQERAICGYRPQSPNAYLMAPRGTWKWQRTERPDAKTLCPRCAQHEERGCENTK